MANTLKTNCPFTLTEYRALLKLAKSRFPFISYSGYKNYDSFILWRHDVEYNIREMDKLAEINSEEGIKATFFIQLHCNLYNFWEKENIDIFKNWIENGHDIGLHFDCGFYGDEVLKKIEELILKEKIFLENELETTVKSFAYHNPNENTLKYQENYCGLINTYNPDLFNGDVLYVSDSNGRWREKTIRDVLENKNILKVQVNSHDTWWTDERIPQIQKFENAISRHAKEQIEHYRNSSNIVVEDII